VYYKYKCLCDAIEGETPRVTPKLSLQKQAGGRLYCVNRWHLTKASQVGFSAQENGLTALWFMRHRVLLLYGKVRWFHSYMRHFQPWLSKKNKKGQKDSPKRECADASRRVRQVEQNESITIPLKIIWMKDLRFWPNGRYITFNILAVTSHGPLLDAAKSGSLRE